MGTYPAEPPEHHRPGATTQSRDHTLRVRRVCRLCALALLLAAATFGATDRAQEVDAIREAAFRYMFAHNASGAKQSAKVYCLAIEDKDPDEAFLARFAGSTPPVKKRSECKVSGRGVRDKATGGKGLVFNVAAIRWVTDVAVEVDGGYYEANLSASGNTYSLEKTDEGWAVVKDEMHWIS